MSLFPIDIEDEARRIVWALSERGLMISTAESCTGGLIIGALTDIAGSSAVVDRGFVRGATVTRVGDGPGASRPLEVRAEFTIVADGANSRFGRALGTSRRREWPYGTAIRTYWESPRHQDPWIESALDVKDRNGQPMPGSGSVPRASRASIRRS